MNVCCTTPAAVLHRTRNADGAPLESGSRTSMPPPASPSAKQLVPVWHALSSRRAAPPLSSVTPATTEKHGAVVLVLWTVVFRTIHKLLCVTLNGDLPSIATPGFPTALSSLLLRTKALTPDTDTGDDTSEIAEPPDAKMVHPSTTHELCEATTTDERLRLSPFPPVVLHAAMRHSLDPVIVTGCDAKAMADTPGQLNMHLSTATRLPAETAVDEYAKHNAPETAPRVSKAESSTIQLLSCSSRIGVCSTPNPQLKDDWDDMMYLHKLKDQWLLEEIVAAEDMQKA